MQAKIQRSLWALLIILPITAILWIMLGLFVAPPVELLTGGPSRPAGFPSDARRTYNFVDGSSWYYCRNTPSGHVWVGKYPVSEPFFRFQAGLPCGAKTRPDLVPSNSSPAFIVGPTVSIRFVLPGDERRFGYNRCPQTLGLDYLKGAHRHLSEVIVLNDTTIERKRILLEAVLYRLSPSNPPNLEWEGSDGGESYCGFERAKKHA